MHLFATMMAHATVIYLHNILRDFLAEDDMGEEAVCLYKDAQSAAAQVAILCRSLDSLSVFKVTYLLTLNSHPQCVFANSQDPSIHPVYGVLCRGIAIP